MTKDPVHRREHLPATRCAGGGVDSADMLALGERAQPPDTGTDGAGAALQFFVCLDVEKQGGRGSDLSPAETSSPGTEVGWGPGRIGGAKGSH